MFLDCEVCSPSFFLQPTIFVHKSGSIQKQMSKNQLKCTVLALAMTVIATIATIVVVLVVRNQNKQSAKHNTTKEGVGPTMAPSSSAAPSLRASDAPSISLRPSSSPSSNPSTMPSVLPTEAPSITPSRYPSTKPSFFPTFQPTSFNFVLKMHWERQYFWQETYAEFHWCAECTKCRSLTVSDKADSVCEDSNTEDPTCSEFDQLWVQDCEDRKGSAIFNVDRYSTFDMLRIKSTNLCLTRTVERFVNLQKCSVHNRNQKWQRISLDAPFDLRGVDVPSNNMCMTNTHHPKASEIYRMQECSTTYSYNTALWDAIPY